MQKIIEVRTDPPGAVIEYNGNMIGPSPCEFSVDIDLPYAGCMYGNYNTFWRVAKEDYNYIRAFPATDKQYSQVKILSDYDIVKQKNLIIYFNMYLKPIPKEYKFDFQKNR